MKTTKQGNERHHRWILWAMALWLWAGTAQAQDSYRIATEGTYPPWSFKDAQGTLQGWDGMLPGLMSRKYHLIVASMAITEQGR